MATQNQDELYTIVENMTAGERVFGFLGPRGMRLAAGEAVAVPGDLVASLGAQQQHGGRRRKFDALERSIAAGSLRINSRPSPILWDPVKEEPASIAVVNGVLGTVDYNPDSSSSSSSSAAA